MTSNNIIDILYEKFHSHKYQLANSFVYFWESDWFSMSATGYINEIEIKISKSDFKADFKKVDKHSTLERAFKGEKYRVQKGNLECYIQERNWEYVKDDRGGRVYDPEVNGFKKKLLPGYQPKYRRIGYSESELKKRYKDQDVIVEPISCSVGFPKVDKCPNKFWYICPEGLIQKEEVPEYAGLYWVLEDKSVKIVKKAPFIHKNKQDLKQILLDKFYYLSMRLLRENNFYKRKLNKS